MATSRVELIGYFQVQLRRRGFYEGPIDGEFNPAIDEAIGNYRAALGLSKESLLDEAFFKAYLAADHSKIPRPASPSVFVAPPPAAPATASTTAPAAPAAAAAAAAPTGSAASGPLTLSLSTANRQTRFARGELVNLLVQPTRDAHVYCYLQDETSKITRFYPNRFAKDSLVLASKPLNLPGQMRFQLSMNPKGVTETIACFATQRDVLADLPRGVVGVDFEPLAVTGFEQIRNAFVATAGGAVAQERFNVQAK
jgi:peptidoglycan hydrolase-like protein with peptidoglycan-binding domain